MSTQNSKFTQIEPSRTQIKSLIMSYGMTQTCSFASIVLVVKAIRRSGDTVWAKYEYEIELRLKIVRLSIKFGFGSSTDGKMN